MKNLYAGIISYNPDISKLKNNIEAIHKQIHNVLVYDNGSENYQEIYVLVSEYENVHLIASKTNMGMAAALNRLMQWGYERNYAWMLSLDQDSVCEDCYIEKIVPYLSIEKNLGIVAPVIIDRNVGLVGHDPKNKPYIHVNTCITSGAFSNLAAWKEVSGYDETMFIDSVDFEYCYRLREKGYGVIQVKDVKLSHEIGNSKKRKFLFWNVIVGGHTAFRKYYIARNNVYYPMKHHLWLHFIRGNFRNILLLLKVSLYEKDKNQKTKMILRGWKDGIYSVIKFNSIKRGV